MLHLNVYLVQKCKKHLCCNLFWVPTQFDWTIWQDRTGVQAVALSRPHRCANSGSGKTAQVCKQSLWQDCTGVQAVALARLHRCANSGSGKTAQVCKQWLWQDCTGVQTVALARLHRCAGSGSGKTAQVCKQWLWHDCTGVQTWLNLCQSYMLLHRTLMFYLYNQNNSNSSSLCLFHTIWMAGEKV